MENVGVIFGGKSVEHDISIITALQVMNAFPKKYNMLPLYIRSDGVMVTAQNLNQPSVYLDYAKNIKKESEVAFKTGYQEVFILNKNKVKKTIKLDSVILCNHGHGGEDGSLQGLLELCQIPYSSPSVAASAVCMDKVLTKMVLAENSILTPAYVHFNKCQYEENKDKIFKDIKTSLSFPCIVKPARCGSSVGISICESEDDLTSCIDNALNYDDKIIVEEYIENAREFFCAVLYLGGQNITGKIDEADKDKLYTFEEKYMQEKRKAKGKISKQIEQKIKEMAIKSYSALECDGVVRIDFLYSEDKQLYVNEVNTIPGSLAFNLFESGFEDLLNAIILSAKERREREKQIVYQFNSSAIERFIEMGEMSKGQK